MTKKTLKEWQDQQLELMRSEIRWSRAKIVESETRIKHLIGPWEKLRRALLLLELVMWPLIVAFLWIKL